MAVYARLSRQHGSVLKSPEEHNKHVYNVLTLLSKASVTLKLKKYRIFAKIIDYSAQVICRRRLEIASHTTKTILDLYKPTFVAELGFFPGL